MNLPRDINIIIDRLTREAECGSIIGQQWIQAIQTNDKEQIRSLMLEVNNELYKWRRKDIPNQIKKLTK